MLEPAVGQLPHWTSVKQLCPGVQLSFKLHPACGQCLKTCQLHLLHQCLCCRCVSEVQPLHYHCSCTTACTTCHVTVITVRLLQLHVGKSSILTVWCTGSSVASSLRIWEREGCELHALGAAPQGLHPILAWQPNGRHLYAAHSQGQHHRVVLYETNGLEHGGFDIPRTGDSSHACQCAPRTNSSYKF